MAKTKYTKQKDGYFQTRIWDGTYNEDGTKHRTTLRSKKSSADLEKLVNTFKMEVQKRKNVRSCNSTWLEYSRAWQEVYKANKETATNKMYQNIIEKYFSVIGPVRLQDIDRIHYQQIINAATDKPRTQQQIKLTFKQVLQSAVSDHLYPANVMEDIFAGMDTIKYQPEEKRPLTEYEKKAVFNATLAPQDQAFVYILYGCGLRRGEALSLTRFDIDLHNRVLTVNKAYKFVNDKPVLKGPKTSNGYRTVPIPAIVFPTIEGYVRSLSGTQLFTMRDGKPVTKSSYDKMWARIIRNMQSSTDYRIEGLTAHIFRHNYCTNLCYQIPKISIKKIAELMGDTERMVLEVYNHMMLEKEDAAGAVTDALNF